jgi:hypothetical protein
LIYVNADMNIILHLVEGSAFGGTTIDLAA